MRIENPGNRADLTPVPMPPRMEQGKTCRTCGGTGKLKFKSTKGTKRAACPCCNGRGYGYATK